MLHLPLTPEWTTQWTLRRGSGTQALQLPTLLRIGVAAHHQQVLDNPAHKVVVGVHNRPGLIENGFIRDIPIPDLLDEVLLLILQSLSQLLGLFPETGILLANLPALRPGQAEPLPGATAIRGPSLPQAARHREDSRRGQQHQRQQA
jgi:hypothetical protein